MLFDEGPELVAENLDRNHSFVMDRVLRGAVRSRVENGEHYKAVKATEKWYDWLADVGEATRAPKRRELDMEAAVSHQQTETAEQVFVIDEGNVHWDGGF